MQHIKAVLNHYFELDKHHTSIRQECIAGLTTFLTMSYILFANPTILASTGMNHDDVFFATALVTIIGTVLIGILANYPVAIAPSMALNVYFSYTIVQSLKLSWQSALGTVFIAGFLFFFLSITHIRRIIIQSIPETLSSAIAAGLGLFITLIAFKNVGIIVIHPNSLFGIGELFTIHTLLFVIGFCAILTLHHFKIPGAILFGILITTVLSIIFHISHFQGFFALPPENNSTVFALSFGHLWNHHGIAIILTLLMIALFDSTGTLLGLLHYSGLIHDKNKTKRLSNALTAESLATISGSLLGTSTTSPYIESAAGIRAGGRTGLTALIVAFLFFCSIFLSPLAKTIPDASVSAALLFVACAMLNNLKIIHWKNLSESIPSLATLIIIPCTFSIADGFGAGIISYIIIKLICRNFKAINPVLYIFGIVFIIYFIYRLS